jgi:ligand-binding sensor domain-containing protein/serine phosphatase RsbU (regulator of sigma subunit)
MAFLMLNATFAQRNHFSTEQFTINDGLSNSHITTLFQDSRGFIWVGTSDGLNRYDGYSFKVYRHHPLVDSTIVGNYIQAIVETPDGNVWIGTRNSGIAIWQKKNGKFLNVGKESKLFKALREYGVYGMQIDGDFVWVKTRNAIAKVNYKNHSFKKYDHYSSVLKKGTSNSYPVVTSMNKVWFGSKDGIQFIESDGNHIQRIHPDNSQIEISSITKAGDSLLLAGSVNGLWRYDIKNKQIRSVYKTSDRFKNEQINCLLTSKDGIVWLATSKGLMVCKAPYDTYEEYEVCNQLIEPFKKISSILIDNSGLLWIGTRQDGLFKVDGKPSKFSSISSNGDVQYPIDCFDFQSVFVDEDNNLWLGTAQKGVYRINRDTNQFKHYTVYPPYVSKDDPAVNDIFKDSKGNIWYATNEGVFVIYQGRNRITEFDYTNSSDFRYLLKTNIIKDIIEDKLGHIWFATQFGLYRFDGHKITSYWSDNESENGLCDDEINVLFEDSDGLIWIGTNNGINTYNVVSRTFGRIRNVEGNPKKLSHNIISAFAEDHDKIVIGTHAGLSYFDKNTKEASFWKYDDLISGKIYAVEIDNYHRIWISTGIGISSIIPGTPPFHYNKNDGVPDYNFNISSSCKHGDNELFFGGDKGLTIINSQDVPTNINKPKVVITGVKVFRKGKEQNKYEGVFEDEISILYKRNTMIQVLFSALEFTYPSANTYRVKLEGHDEEWRDVTYQNFVNFSNLSPGEYTLKVKGANNDGVLSPDEAELLIVVTPPLWMSGYAYAFYIIFAVLLIQTLINYRIRNYRKAYKALNEKALDKKKIEDQKETLSRVHLSLTDSISYAKRIQEAMIPSEDMVKQILPESFVYYRPKDIVSGDFYWTYRTGSKVFLAAVDCTGHGVPGAFMSIIGYDLLKNIVEIQGEHCPARILDKLSREVALTFRKNGQDGTLNQKSIDDGMDIALVMIDEEKQVLHFAGAMNPLYIIRDNEIMTFKGDRFSIGYSDENKQLSYSRQEIEVFPSDVVYLFSDGFADQFGGAEGKKFKYRRFRHLLLNIHKLPIDDQKAILHQKMEDWMGTEYEQVDDILLMGFRL